MVQAQDKCGRSTTQTIAVAEKSSAKRGYQLPPNYRPPVADTDRTIFPETYASKKRQKKLRKRRKKRGRKGCPTARM